MRIFYRQLDEDEKSVHLQKVFEVMAVDVNEISLWINFSLYYTYISRDSYLILQHLREVFYALDISLFLSFLKISRRLISIQNCYRENTKIKVSTC